MGWTVALPPRSDLEKHQLQQQYQMQQQMTNLPQFPENFPDTNPEVEEDNLLLLLEGVEL